MRRKREQMKAQLRAEADAVIEQLLDWHEETAALDRLQIEEWVLQLRERLGQRMAEAVIAAQAASQLVEAPVCRQCGVRMAYKGQKAIHAETRVGPAKIERSCYYRARCKSGLFPPWMSNCGCGMGIGMRGWCGRRCGSTGSRGPGTTVWIWHQVGLHFLANRQVVD